MGRSGARCRPGERFAQSWFLRYAFGSVGGFKFGRRQIGNEGLGVDFFYLDRRRSDTGLYTSSQLSSHIQPQLIRASTDSTAQSQLAQCILLRLYQLFS